MDDSIPEVYGSFHTWLQGLEEYRGQIHDFSFFPATATVAEGVRPGTYAPYLERLGVWPYRHQAEALEQVGAGRDVIVATPTASGKSLVYQLATASVLEQGGTALYLFPVKALANDQLGKLRALLHRLEVEGYVESYDGDTPTGRRRGIRERASCVVTNPDMLHFGILPYHAAWARFLAQLQLLVLDELHSYRGVFGSHVANIVRRLLRLARAYGGRPQLIAASATVANPSEHTRNVCGREVAVVTEDGTPRPAREFLFWKPSELPGGERRSVNTEAALLAATFVRSGLQSIFFCNSRKSAELLRRYASGQLPADLEALVRSYRAGYTAEDRRALEAAFGRGEIRVLTATSALELGVDVGGVDAVVLVGYPGSIMSMRQRAGRAGRAGRRALTLLIPGDDPLDEYYLHHPRLLTEGRVESAVADPYNSEIHPLHAICAAAELPVRPGEHFFGPGFDPGAHPQLVNRAGAWAHLGRYPHRRVQVRGTGGGRVRLVDGAGTLLGVNDLATALRELHPGAVYLHQGETYLVAELDLERGRAVLLPHIEDYYTQPRSRTEIEIVQEADSTFGIRTGRVRVSTIYIGYVKKRYLTEVVIDERPLELPELAYTTQALWLSVAEVADAVPEALLPSALHALEHTLIGLLPAFVLCERADIGGVSYHRFPPTDEPVLFIYDGYPGGVGYAHAGAGIFPDWLAATRDLLRDCSCSSGCPRCVLSPKCGNGNKYLDKAAALILAEELLVRLASTVQV